MTPDFFFRRLFFLIERFPDVWRISFVSDNVLVGTDESFSVAAGLDRARSNDVGDVVSALPFDEADDSAICVAISSSGAATVGVLRSRGPGGDVLEMASAKENVAFVAVEEDVLVLPFDIVAPPRSAKSASKPASPPNGWEVRAGPIPGEVGGVQTLEYS